MPHQVHSNPLTQYVIPCLCAERRCLEVEGRAPSAAAACSHTGTACCSALPAQSSPAGCVSQAPCKDVEGMIAHLQTQMGNEENSPHEARGSWRLASPQGPSNARGPGGRTCIFQSSAMLESEQLMCAMLALKEALGLSLLLQALIAKGCSFAAQQSEKVALMLVL